MQTLTIIYIVGALLFSLVISWLLYFYKSKQKKTIDSLLYVLRTTGVFLLLILLINPKIEREEIINEKPILSVLIDNSLSIKEFNKQEDVLKIFNNIRRSTNLKDKFKVHYYQFGESLTKYDSLSFSESQTNVFEAINSLEALNNNAIAPIVLLTDGNQTNGNLYSNISTKKNIFPLVIGDTISPVDIKISGLNVNKYSFLNNKFPVEITVLYDGVKTVKSQLIIEKNGKVVFRKNINLDTNNNIEIITTNLLSNIEGLHYYKVFVKPLKEEKNKLNNEKVFSIEVLNKQAKILLLTSVLHPDIGAFKKAIETNKQRTVLVNNINEFKGDLSDYQLVILYQPSIDFLTVFKEINKKNISYFVVTGANTNWNFLNEMQSNYIKESINQTEEYLPVFNNGFLTFTQKDINFNTFSPLKDVFGKITMKNKHDVLLNQSVAGIETKSALLATFENESQKSAVLFGEGIWKWRATSYLNSKSFQDFDAFISNLVQYVSSTKKRERLSINYENLYLANTPIVISAFYVDKNFQFDSRAILQVSLTNTDTNIRQNIPFSLQNNSFEAVLENLPSGNYQFQVFVEKQPIKKSGKFIITKYQVEKQFTKANTKDLNLLAVKTKGKMFYEKQINELLNQLLTDKRYVTIQKSKKIQQHLIDWELLLFIIIFLFSLEWFIRKYYGKI
mgnify:CR=1 FL=1